MRRIALVTAAVLCAVAAASHAAPGLIANTATRAAVSVAPPPAERPVLVSNDWLSVVNFYRATASVAPLGVNAAWSGGAYLHSRYMAMNNVIGHSEARGKPFYTAEGDAVARNSNVFLGSGKPFPDRYLVEGWMTGPFHAIGMVNPWLRQTGYGGFRGERTGATLDTLRGLADHGMSPHAVVWPGNGMQVPLTAYNGFESPSPLSFCPGYPQKSGLPVFAMLPKGVRVTGASIAKRGAPLTSCFFDARSPGDGYAAELLANRNAVVVMPRAPLEQYVPHTVTLQTTSGPLTWSFTAGEVTPPHNVRLGGAVLQPMQTSPTFPVSWAALDNESGVASYDIRYRTAPRGGTFGTPTVWQTGVTATSATFSGQTGSTYCFSVRAMDKAGNRSPWTGERCTALPLAAMDLAASPLLWLPQADPAYYAGTARLALTPGSTLTIAATNVRRIAVLVTTCSGCGTLDVTFRGNTLATVDLDRPTAHRVVVEVGRFANAWSGDVVLTATSTLSQVVVEGLGLAAA